MNIMKVYTKQFVSIFIFLFILSMNANAALKDEVITICFVPDDGTDRTISELIKLKMIGLGDGIYTGAGYWTFHLDTIETDDEHVEFHLSLIASGLLKEDGKIEISLIGSDFERSVLNQAQFMRFTRAHFTIDSSSMTGKGKGFTEDEIHKGGTYSLSLTSAECP